MTLAPPAAHADVVGVGLIVDPTYYTQTSAYTSGASCTLSEAGGTDNKPLPVDGTRVTNTRTRSGTATDGTGKVTTLSRSVDVAAKVTSRGNGQLAGLDLAVSGFAQVAAQAGQTCYATAYAGGGAVMDFTLLTPQWVTVSVSGGRQADSWIEAYEEDSGEPGFYLSTRESSGTVTGTFLLTPGTYEFETGIGWGAYAYTGEAGHRREGHGSVSMRLHDTGGAIAAPAGTGRAYLTPGPAVNCATRTLPTTFTARGGRVKSATFLVNGVQKRVVRNPVAGQRVTLTALPSFRRNDIRVRLVVDPPGRVRTATVVSTRSYRACGRTL